VWLHIPTSLFSAASECSTLPSTSLYQALAASGTANGKDRQPRYWRRAWGTANWTKRLSTPTCDPSQQESIVERWLESLADSPVRTSASQEGRRGSTVSEAGCSSRSSDSFAIWSPSSGSFSKTSLQFSLFQQEQPYLDKLPNSGSMRSGELFERPMLVRRIDGTGRSFWPTAMVNDVEKRGDFNANRTVCLTGAAQTWPTPRGEDSESCGNHPGATDSLTGAARQWATPNVPNGGRTLTPEEVAAKGATENGKRQVGLENQAKFWPTTNAHDGRRPGSDATSTQGANLKRDAEQWATPQAHDSSGGDPSRVGRFGTTHGGRNLADDVTAWPTPKARDWKSAEGDRGAERNDPDLNVIASRFSRPDQTTSTTGAESSPSGQTSRRRLNPAFVEWLMALPHGWTDYAPVEMASWRSKARRRLSLWLNEQGYWTGNYSLEATDESHP